MHLLTGATGFLGREILRDLLLGSAEPVALLVRHASGQEAETRIKKLLAELLPEQSPEKLLDRISLIPGDVTLERFGMGDAEFEQLSQRIHSVMHCAAATALNQDLEDARIINVGGTRHALELAKLSREHGNQVEFHHVSTAYAAGRSSNVVYPSDLRIDGPFRNAYEQSKAEAEREVRSFDDMFRTAIYRPSLIVGDSTTGHSSVFSHFFIPARLFTMGLFKAFPASPQVPVDIVPVDWVADAILHLRSSNAPSGSCFHLCAGVGRETTLSEILDILIEAFNNYRVKGRKHLHRPQFLSAEMIALLELSVSASLSFAKIGVRNLEKIFHRRLQSLADVFPFFPYMTQNPQFNTASTTQYLSGLDRPEAPLFSLYAERIFRYCLVSNWGRNPFQPSTA